MGCKDRDTSCSMSLIFEVLYYQSQWTRDKVSFPCISFFFFLKNEQQLKREEGKKTGQQRIIFIIFLPNRSWRRCEIVLSDQQSEQIFTHEELWPCIILSVSAEKGQFRRCGDGVCRSHPSRVCCPSESPPALITPPQNAPSSELLTTPLTSQ